jgi:hypothetical protein
MLVLPMDWVGEQCFSLILVEDVIQRTWLWPDYAINTLSIPKSRISKKLLLRALKFKRRVMMRMKLALMHHLRRSELAPAEPSKYPYDMWIEIAESEPHFYVWIVYIRLELTC